MVSELRGGLMDDEQWAKIAAARSPWDSIKHREDWPAWVDLLETSLRAWLHDERVDYAVFGYDEGEGDAWASNALESTRLTAVILSSRYITQVSVAKGRKDRGAEAPAIRVVPRSEINALSLIPEKRDPQFGRGFVILAEFKGIDEPLQIPADASAWWAISETDRLRIFGGLRDDLLLRK